MRALWSDRPHCSHNVSQKVKRIKRFSELRSLPDIGTKDLFFFPSPSHRPLLVFADSTYGLPNLWFACGSPFTETTEITKMTKTTKTTQTATNKELSAGFAEITETTKMTKTTGIQGANHGLPKPRV